MSAPACSTRKHTIDKTPRDAAIRRQLLISGKGSLIFL